MSSRIITFEVSPEILARAEALEAETGLSVDVLAMQAFSSYLDDVHEDPVLEDTMPFDQVEGWRD